MKNPLKILPQIAFCAVLAFLFVSCSDDNLNSDVAENDLSIYEIISSNASASSAEISKRSPKKGTSSIAEIAIGANFNELVKALSYVDNELNTGLVDLFLNGKSQYTVFAPTDDAFNTLYKTLGVGGITELDASLVLSVLQYHVTDGRRASNSVVPKKNVKTIETLLEGATFDVYPNLMIQAVGNTAMIKAADISASNGIIHVIDTVILPISLD